jgi:hypothetical protein
LWLPSSFALPALLFDKLDNQGGDGETVQPEKGQSAGNCLRCAHNPKHQVHAVLGSVIVKLYPFPTYYQAI